MVITPKDVINMARGNISYTDISRLMGKSENYTASMVNRRTIGAQVMVDILDALGYDTIVRNKSTNEEVRISPSRDDVIIPYSLTITVNDESLRERIEQYIRDGTLEDRLKNI